MKDYELKFAEDLGINISDLRFIYLQESRRVFLFFKIVIDSDEKLFDAVENLWDTLIDKGWTLVSFCYI